MTNRKFNNINKFYNRYAMGDILLFLKNNLAEHFVFYFIPLYYFGGRPIALISAQLLGHQPFFLLPVAIMLDTIQIPFFYHLYGTISNSSLMQKLYQKGRKKEADKRGSKLFRWLQAFGSPGVVVIAMLPLKGCGMLSGFILSKLLRLPKIQGYLLLIIGSILGCGMLLGIGEMILKGWKYFFASV
jgi:uncharacterized membrane protein